MELSWNNQQFPTGLSRLEFPKVGGVGPLQRCLVQQVVLEDHAHKNHQMHQPARITGIHFLEFVGYILFEEGDA